MDGKNPARWRKGVRKQKLQADHDQLYKELEKQLNPTDDKEKEKTGDDLEKDEGKGQTAQEPSDKTTPPFVNNPEENQIVAKADGSNSLEDPLIAHMYPKSKHGRTIVLPNQATAEELQASKQPTEDKLDLVAWKEEMPERDAEEIESLFRTDEEIAQKEAIFNSLNKEYLLQQERKESERMKEEEAAKDKEEDELAQAEGHARYVKTKNGRKRRRDGSEGEVPTTEEALLAAVSTRKISRKINYDAMSSLFGDDGGFSTEGVESNEPAHDELNYAMV